MARERIRILNHERHERHEKGKNVKLAVQHDQRPPSELTGEGIRIVNHE